MSGGFATPVAAELIGAADLIVGWGCSLNMWTMRHGRLIGPDTTVVQVDDDVSAIGAHRPVDLAVLGDAAQTGRAVLAELAGQGGPGYRSPQLQARIAREGRWRDVPYPDEGARGMDGPGEDGDSIALLDIRKPAEAKVIEVLWKRSDGPEQGAVARSAGSNRS